jgi:hypothetical protein
MYAAGSARVNRDPNTTSETRVESFRVHVRGRVVRLVAGCVGGCSDVRLTLFSVESRVVSVVGSAPLMKSRPPHDASGLLLGAG